MDPCPGLLRVSPMVGWDTASWYSCGGHYPPCVAAERTGKSDGRRTCTRCMSGSLPSDDSGK